MNQDANSRSEGARRARFPRLQFRLRTLFLLTLALAVLCSWTRVTISAYQRGTRAYGTLLFAGDPFFIGSNHFWREPLPKYAPSTLVIRLFVEEEPSVVKFAMLSLMEPEPDLSPLSELTHLERLSLCGEINDETLVHITALNNLYNLRLTSSDVTDKSLQHLSNCRRLRQLQIRFTEITGSALADSPCLAKLQTLLINSKQLGQGGATLCSRLGSQLEDAKVLGVWCDRVDDGHIEAMSALPKGCTVVLIPQGHGVLFARSDSYISDVVMAKFRSNRPDIKLIVTRSAGFMVDYL